MQAAASVTKDVSMTPFGWTTKASRLTTSPASNAGPASKTAQLGPCNQLD